MPRLLNLILYKNIKNINYWRVNRVNTQKYVNSKDTELFQPLYFRFCFLRGRLRICREIK